MKWTSIGGHVINTNGPWRDVTNVYDEYVAQQLTGSEESCQDGIARGALLTAEAEFLVHEQAYSVMAQGYVAIEKANDFDKRVRAMSRLLERK